MKRSNRSFVVGFLVGLMVLAIPMAVLALSINIVGPGPYAGGITFLDNGPEDSIPALGAMSITAGSLGAPAMTPNFNLSINTATSNSPGGPIVSFLDLAWNLQSTGSTGGSVTVTATDGGYTFPPNGTKTTLLSQLNGNIGGGGGSVTGQQFVILADGTKVTPGLQALNTIASVDFTTMTPFQLQEVLNMTLNASSLTTGDFLSETGKVPEPMSLILLGGGLAGAGLYRRLRKPKG